MLFGPLVFLYIYRISLKVFGEISGPLIIFFFRTQRTLYSKFKKAHPNLHLFKHPYPAQNSQRLLFPFFFFFLFSLSLCILRNNKKGGSFYTYGDHNWVHWCGCGCGRGAEAPKPSCSYRWYSIGSQKVDLGLSRIWVFLYFLWL